jgi:hypothetical protein
MSSKLVTGHVWGDIKRAIKRSKGPSFLAIAFVGSGAGALLPLKAGSCLVADVSEASVKAGRTSPNVLRRLISRNGVRVFSVRNLHAKVIVTDTRAFIGSANASQSSASALIEAVLQISDRGAIARARRFVMDLCVDECGPAELKRLARLYRPAPAVRGAHRRGVQRGKRLNAEVGRVFTIQLVDAEPPLGSSETIEQGRRKARRKVKPLRRGTLDWFFSDGVETARPGDIIIRVEEGAGGRCTVCQPAKIVHQEKWGRGSQRAVFSFFEGGTGRRIDERRLIKLAGKGTEKYLQRNGAVPREIALQILAHLRSISVDGA